MSQNVTAFGENRPQPASWQTSRWQSFLNIRNKIILPYLAITIFVAAIGTYIVTRLVAGSLQERLSNQLVESSRVASESVVRLEQRQLETLRLMAFTYNIDQAILQGDQAYLQLAIGGLAENANLKDVIVLDQQSDPLYRQGDFPATRQTYLGLTSVQAVLAGESDANGDKFGEIIYSSNPPLFIIASPVTRADQPEEIVGAIVVGIPLNDVLATIKRESLADVIAYDASGQMVSSTFFLTAQESANLQLTPTQVDEQLTQIRTEETSDTAEIQASGRVYQGMYIPFEVRAENVGLLAVYLPSEFIVLEGGTSARIFAVLFTISSAMIVFIGIVIAAAIVNPVNRLVSVAQEVTLGDLTRRSTVRSSDEIGFLGLTFDLMTERLEERTRQLEIEATRLNSILATSQTGMLLIDAGRDLVFINQAAQRFLQSKVNIEQFLHLEPTDRLEINGFILATQRTEIVDEKQELIGTLVGLNDITRQELARRLQDRFIAQVSHELRTPLTVIKGYSDLVSTMIELGRPPEPDHVQNILRQTNILDKMIIELLNISQMNAGTFGLRRSKLDLRELLLEAINNEKEAFLTAQLEYRCDLPDRPCPMEGDYQRLLWLFHHLLDNAIKYTGAGGQVGCKLEPLETTLRVTVWDTGYGIRAVDLPYVWEAYYRREVLKPNGETIDPRGMGLGLYIVKMITLAHHGVATLESIQGAGTQVIISLPIQKEV